MIMFVIICAASGLLFWLLRDKDEEKLKKEIKRREREARKAQKGA